ncbi:TAXI family TRAP transporter solute-binding subunit [Micromonospora noduli]|uniref:31 kDa immunogenic protein n=1 Tax=Micromonospora noduli TaxID=709876 RepID=A0ABX9CY96_9ACTN|nr:TAXI family TRAP transporter solute-binding subunit [Micromonospora noduli]RAO11101.1 31 kDa immunogenic protein [Micromonospora noduli]RAO13019.1 31 kDa immunogenic protein [Micromonospora noduli]RAO15737.1 31 kDa immunogenic protein [Micromonospora noduli]RAO21973.1 31 kDa immunogenic protein [Micromonospora noduli]
MRRIDVRLAAGLSVLALVTVGAAGCGGQQGGAATDDTASEVTCEVTKETRVGIATGNATGVYYVVGNALAGQLSGSTGGKLTGTAAETGASVQNIEQLVGGQYDVAFSLFDTAVNAVEGKGSFTAPQPVEALARIYDNYTQVVVRNDSGITSVADMRGKRISTGSPKSGTEVIANRLLEAAGLDPAKDIRAQRLDLTKTVEGVKDGSVDGFFWSGGLPTGGLTDLFTTAGDSVKFVDISPLLPKMAALSPGYQEGTIGRDAYKTAADTPTIVVPNVLLVRKDLDANVACAITRTVFDKRDALAQANPAAKGISLEKARRTLPVPLHRGAEKALKDLGAN